MIKARMLNKEGVLVFQAYLEQLRNGIMESPPFYLLEDSKYSQPLQIIIELDQISFPSRLSAGEYLTHQIGDKLQEVPISDLLLLGSWLSLFYFDIVCPSDSEGQRYPGKDYRHIPSSDWRDYYRHLLLGPLQLYRRHGSKARLLLAGTVDQPGDFNEQIASRQEFVASDGMIQALDKLYYSEEISKPKKGATTSDKAGGLRRFVDLMQQLDLTHDLQSMGGQEIISLLPSEFDNWKC